MTDKIFRILSHFSFYLIIIPLVVLIAGYSVVFAQVSQQVYVTATVPERPPLEEPDTIVVFRGIAYPSSSLSVKQDNVLLVSLTTDAQASFDVSVNVDPGTYTFSVMGIDNRGLEGKISNFTLTMAQGTTTTISGIFLGPTITADVTAIVAGETLTLSGTTVPQSEVHVNLSQIAGGAAAAAGPRIAVEIASADNNGRWVQLVNADDLSIGTYAAKAQAVESGGSVSEYSKEVNFSVAAADQCGQSSPGDLNCDGFVNLVDFSILLFYWNSTAPANPRADINKDAIVNITDFSIMLYYWT